VLRAKAIAAGELFIVCVRIVSEREVKEKEVEEESCEVMVFMCSYEGQNRAVTLPDDRRL
jgi:hypothetical protein